MMLEKFPEIIIWNCLNYRLQLSLDDSISKIKQVNHLKIFLDKIYSIYHQSNKNQNKLLEPVAKDLEIEIFTLGLVGDQHGQHVVYKLLLLYGTHTLYSTWIFTLLSLVWQRD